MRKDYCRDRESAWGYGNTILYKMCLKDQPRHNDPDAVAGKMWLIGRSYAASPERGAGNTPQGENPDFFRWLADQGNWSELDAKLGELSDRNYFSLESLNQILDIHYYFREFIRKATIPRMNGTEPRQHTSFCSKYLHFHRPDHFPIYDSYVVAAVAREIARETSQRRRFTIKLGDHDPRYDRFCQQLIEYQKLDSSRSVKTLRELDRDLYEKERLHRNKEKRQFRARNRNDN